MGGNIDDVLRSRRDLTTVSVSLYVYTLYYVGSTIKYLSVYLVRGVYTQYHKMLLTYDIGVVQQYITPKLESIISSLLPGSEI